jgi:aspartyl-tRNA synthetase
MDIEEELRLKYRYLDLRRKRLQKNLRLRSDYVQACRDYLFSQDFVEIETPMLTKSTPEGSRDFVVPSRLQPGKFFALPQSPQQYKQLLMTAGFERYFQIARCIRDEDPRSDRTFEHTQVDLELSFTDREAVMHIVEQMIITALEKTGFGDRILQKPFPVITYKEAMDTYGADKFDVRSDQEKAEQKLGFTWVVDFPFFEKTQSGGWTFTHNPFSRPLNDDHETWLLQKKNIDQILTSQYDLVLNGLEIAGGSIRAHNPEVLQAVFEIMGYQATDIKAQFGHMLEAFKLGTPPHGGCAHGFERLLMAVLQEHYLREVQAFPQTGKGTTSVMDAPAELTNEQLNELRLEVTAKDFDTVYDALIDLLNRREVEYHEYHHQPVFTSEEAADVRGDVTVGQGAKAMVLTVKDNHVLYILPGDQQIDLKRLRQHFDTGQVKLASLENIEAITGVKPGGVPPFGSLMGLKTFVDRRLADHQQIAFNAGRNDRSIRMSFEAFIRLEQPQVVDLDH